MQMTIRYHQSGLRVDAILLAANSDRMRVVVARQRDTFELRRVDACWRTEDGIELEIEALVAMPGTEVADFCSGVYPRADTAGRASMLI